LDPPELSNSPDPVIYHDTWIQNIICWLDKNVNSFRAMTSTTPVIEILHKHPFSGIGTYTAEEVCFLAGKHFFKKWRVNFN
jgi:hypothetical protein